MSIINSFENNLDFIDLTNSTNVVKLKEDIKQLDIIISVPLTTLEVIEDLKLELRTFKSQLNTEINSITTTFAKVKFRQENNYRYNQLKSMAKEIKGFEHSYDKEISVAVLAQKKKERLMLLLESIKEDSNEHSRNQIQ